MPIGAQASFPGIYFEVADPPLRESLPRMDIAAFVGYAASGPLHVPVPVADVQRFRELFGADLKLAWDEEHNTTGNSCLGMAVDSFFRNGGRRCWVVRVAEEELAQTAGFELPGIVRVDDSTLEKCRALARSPGSWSRDLAVNTVLQVTRLPLSKADPETAYLSLGAGGWSAQLVADASALRAGDLLRVKLFEGAMLYLVVGSVEATSQGVAVAGTTGYLYVDQADGSPPSFDCTLRITPGEDFDADAEDLPLLFSADNFDALGISRDWFARPGSPDDALQSLELLHFQWLVNDTHKQRWKLEGLGFCADNSRFWGALPSDELLFAHSDGKANEDIDADRLQLIQQADRPRFPLCAEFADSLSSHDWIYLPLQVPTILDESLRTESDIPASANPLYLDGIENAGSRAFVDERLESVGSDLLRQEARQIAYLSEGAAPLKGIHSLVRVEEATLVAVPDAIHRRWDNLAPDRELPLAAPLLEDIEAETWPGEYRIRWSAVAEAMEYRLQWSESPDFDAVESVLVQGDRLTVIDEPADLMPAPATQYVEEFAQDCPRNYYFRVRAENRNEVSAWSNQLARTIPDDDFIDCAEVPLERLAIALDREPALVSAVASPEEDGGDEGYRLRLRLFSSGSPMLSVMDSSFIERLEIQRAREHSFLAPDQLFFGDREELELAADGIAEFFVEASEDTTYYYRARGFAGQTTGPWSNILIIDPRNLSRTLLQPLDDFSDRDILAVHRALLRLCYARGDLFGVLALPRHYSAQQAREHVSKLNPSASDRLDSGFTADPLSADVPPLRHGEIPVLSHAGLYFPWLASHTDNPASGRVAIRYLPPDGAVVGKIAAKSIEQGAWIAPANSPINNVLALDTRITDAQWAELRASRINVVRRGVTGFLVLSADTLSRNPELSEISVRRLMSLLVRLALRAGNRYLFEPNNADLASRMQLHFESLFDRLYARGAFAGKSTAEAYRVVTDASINTRQSIDAGRFRVDLQVAPSLPLKFIRIRLVQSGPNQLQVQEVS